MAETVFWNDGACSLAASNPRDPAFYTRAVHLDARLLRRELSIADPIRSLVEKTEQLRRSVL